MTGGGQRPIKQKKEKTIKEMVKWTRVGAEKYGVPEAQSNLGNYYSLGKGAQKSFKEAAK
jgi:TPR repeat protein